MSIQVLSVAAAMRQDEEERLRRQLNHHSNHSNTTTTTSSPYASPLRAALSAVPRLPTSTSSPWSTVAPTSWSIADHLRGGRGTSLSQLHQQQEIEALLRVQQQQHQSDFALWQTLQQVRGSGGGASSSGMFGTAAAASSPLWSTSLLSSRLATMQQSLLTTSKLLSEDDTKKKAPPLSSPRATTKSPTTTTAMDTKASADYLTSKMTSTTTSPDATPKITADAAVAAAPTAAAPSRTRVLALDCDEDNLSAYQCLIRQHMQVFEATPTDCQKSVQGRNKPVQIGQVGIQCRHCATAASTSTSNTNNHLYFPTKLDRVYQAAQQLSALHFCASAGNGGCPHLPASAKRAILQQKERKSPAGGGKRYWAEGVQCLGVVEQKGGGLYFAASSSASSSTK